VWLGLQGRGPLQMVLRLGFVLKHVHEGLLEIVIGFRESAKLVCPETSANAKQIPCGRYLLS
jgi:hypothetical protein